MGERAILADEAFLGLQASDIVAGVDIETTQRIQWEDTSATAQMTVDFVEDERHTACVLPAGMGVDGKEQFRFSVLGNVRLTTDDGRLDVTLPTRARTRGSEGAWSDIELFTSPVVAPAAGFWCLAYPALQRGATRGGRFFVSTATHHVAKHSPAGWI